MKKEKILCIFGKHDLEDVKVKRCTAKAHLLLSGIVVNTDALAKLCVCKNCGKKIGIITDGEVSTKYSYDYLVLTGFFE